MIKFQDNATMWPSRRTERLNFSVLRFYNFLQSIGLSVMRFILKPFALTPTALRRRAFCIGKTNKINSKGTRNYTGSLRVSCRESSVFECSLYEVG